MSPKMGRVWTAASRIAGPADLVGLADFVARPADFELRRFIGPAPPWRLGSPWSSGSRETRGGPVARRAGGRRTGGERPPRDRAPWVRPRSARRLRGPPADRARLRFPGPPPWACR